jgi:hypothetical protein
MERGVLELSLNGQTGSLNPASSDPADNHGTACAGVAAATANNGYCGQGSVSSYHYYWVANYLVNDSTM